MTSPSWLIPYAGDSFAKLHDPGAGVITASQVPALFNASPWCSRYALAAHLAGKAPLSQPDHGRIELGRRLERVALDMLGEDRCGSADAVVSCNGYAEHGSHPLIASPDGTYQDARGEWGIVEVKTTSPRKFKADWRDGPPLHVMLQHQTQFACTGAPWGVVVALVVGDFEFFLAPFDTSPHPKAIARIEREVEAFMAMLDRGEMPEPEPEPSDSTMAALEAMFAPDAEKVVSVDGPEAVLRFERWQQAQLDRKAAEATEEACKRWFAAKAADAGRILIGNAAEITRKQVHVKAHERKASTQTRWALKSHAEQEVA